MVPTESYYHKGISKLYHSVSKLITKVKVFKKWVKLQGQSHSVKHNGTHGKVSSYGILMWNIKALALTVQKLLTRLQFQRGRQNDNEGGQKQFATDLRSRRHNNAKNTDDKTSHFS